MKPKRFLRTRNVVILALVVVIAVASGVYMLTRGNPGDIGSGVHQVSTSSRKLHAKKLAQTENVTWGKPISKTYSIGPSGSLKPSVTFDIPLSEQPPPVTTPLRAVRTDAGVTTQTVLPVMIMPDGKTGRITTDRLSQFTIVSVLPQQHTADLNKAFLEGMSSEITADVKSPKCSDKAKAADIGYAANPLASSKKKKTLTWCLGMQGKTPVIELVNTRTYPLDITHKRLSVLRHSSSHDLTALAQLGQGKDTTVLYPGDELDLALKSSDDKVFKMHAELDGLALNLYRIQFLVMDARGTLKDLKILPEGGKWEQQFDRTLTSASCLAVATNDVKKSDFGDLVKNCTTQESLNSAFGASGIVAWAGMTAGSFVQYFLTHVQEAIDGFKGQTSYDLVAQRNVVVFHGVKLFLPASWYKRYGSSNDTADWSADQVGISPDCYPQDYWAPCRAFWLIGSGELDHYADGGQHYEEANAYYPATDIRPCVGQPILDATRWRLDGPTQLSGPATKRLGTTMANYRTWQYKCVDGTASGYNSSGPVTETFTQGDWYDRAHRVLGVTDSRSIQNPSFNVKLDEILSRTS